MYCLTQSYTGLTLSKASWQQDLICGYSFSFVSLREWWGRHKSDSDREAALTSAKVILLACFLISVSPRRSFILRYLQEERSVRLSLLMLQTSSQQTVFFIRVACSAGSLPPSTSLLPLSIQRGRQWFDLLHWRRLLPFIKLPLYLLL